MVKRRGVMCIELQEYALSCQDDVEEFSRRVAECLHPTESPKIVLDLSETIAIGSQMLGEIIALSKQVRALGGRMALCNLQSPVRQLYRSHFDLARMFGACSGCAGSVLRSC
jgi:anti-anti-sigma factor